MSILQKSKRKYDPMTMEQRYRERYESADTPWDIGRPDFNLVEVVTERPVASGKALEIGCGTGDNAIWLARNGFEVTATDTSDVALAQAREKAARANVTCNFVPVDFVRDRVAGAAFGFAFDRDARRQISSWR